MQLPVKQDRHTNQIRPNAETQEGKTHTKDMK